MLSSKNHYQLPRRKRAGYEKEKCLLCPLLPDSLPKERELAETPPLIYSNYWISAKIIKPFV